MLLFTRRHDLASVQTLTKVLRLSSAASKQKDESTEEEEFRVLHLIPQRKAAEKTVVKHRELQPPRTTKMAVDQDWTAVWPAPRTFHPAVVPIPIRQGYPRKGHPPPSKYGNAELMKIPNFLHLTPPAVKKHCEALKKFCSPWPEGLETDADCRKHFPVEIISSDYCYSSPTIRDPLARIVSLRVKLSSLKLDDHAKDKILRLLKDKYNPKKNMINITADRCPTKKQNKDYVYYLLTAVYNEAWRVEPWEAEKSLADMEYYDWDRNKSRTNLVNIIKWPDSPTDYDYETIPHADEYKTAVSDLINKGEDQYTINKYKEAVKNVLHLSGNKKG